MHIYFTSVYNKTIKLTKEELIMKKLLLIGGKQSIFSSKQSKILNIEIIHHPGKIKQKNTKRYFEPMIKKADCIVLFADACSHKNMWDVRALSKEYQKPILFPKGTGLSKIIDSAINELNKELVG